MNTQQHQPESHPRRREWLRYWSWHAVSQPRYRRAPICRSVDQGRSGLRHRLLQSLLSRSVWMYGCREGRGCLSKSSTDGWCGRCNSEACTDPLRTPLGKRSLTASGGAIKLSYFHCLTVRTDGRWCSGSGDDAAHNFRVGTSDENSDGRCGGAEGWVHLDGRIRKVPVGTMSAGPPMQKAEPHSPEIFGSASWISRPKFNPAFEFEFEFLLIESAPTNLPWWVETCIPPRF